ncbi:MAG TPA: type III PLP-dependent enzyme [Candidatus Saccharimonadales bacterium]|jgi:ornithine decarboxylase
MKDQEQDEWLAKIAAAGVLKTPYALTDLNIIVEKAHQFKKLLPRVGLYYAIKSNSDSRIIDTLDDIVDGFDIASLGEFKQLQKQGIAADRLVYSNPVKIPGHIAETYKSGVRYYAFDSLAEVQKLQEHAPGATVYIRLKVSDYGSKFPLSGKFGIDPMHAIAYASAAKDAGLQMKGLTFHVGSQAENRKVWTAAFKTVAGVIKSLERVGINIEFVDIGGGFPANYEDFTPSIIEVADTVNRAIDQYIPDNIRLFAEPGRYLSANASIMATTVIGREHRSGTDWLYIDVGTFQGLIEPLEISGWKYPITTEKSAAGYKKTFVLTGPTCDACDTLGTDYELPSDVSVGDKLYIGAAGAYTLVYASRFNGFEIPKTYYIEREK